MVEATYNPRRKNGDKMNQNSVPSFLGGEDFVERNLSFTVTVWNLAKFQKSCDGRISQARLHSNALEVPFKTYI